MNPDDQQDTFEKYKPFRNYLRQFEVQESLGVLYAYSQFIQNGRPMPSDIEVGPKYLLTNPSTAPHDFFLERIAVEVLVNGSSVKTKKTLREWRYFAGAVNTLKSLEESLISEKLSNETILYELMRIIYREFRWQQKPNAADIIRYYKIFSQPLLRPIIEAKLGMELISLFRYTQMLYGSFLKFCFLDSTYSREVIEKLGWSYEEYLAFLNLFSKPTNVLRISLKSEQEINDKFVYAYNSLISYPIILCDDGRYACPFPHTLVWRATSGIFYDIVEEVGFSKAWGESFQNYIGEVLAKTPYLPIAEQTYMTSKGGKRTVDWILDAGSQVFFIECKTKRVTKTLKSTLDPEVVKSEINPLVDAIIQAYKGIQDCKLNKYPNFTIQVGQIIWPLIVTLEDWWPNKFLRSQILQELKVQMTSVSLPLDYIEEYPFTICSSSDLEDLASALSILNTTELDKLREVSRESLSLNQVFRKEFPEKYESIRKNVHFEEEFKSLADVIETPSTRNK